MVHDQIHRHERFDDLGIFAKLLHGGAHGREIHKQRHTGEILQHNARDDERNFRRARFHGFPVGKLLHIRFLNFQTVAIAQDGLQHDADGHRQFGDRTDASGFQCGQRIKAALFPVAEIKCLKRVE